MKNEVALIIIGLEFDISRILQQHWMLHLFVYTLSPITGIYIRFAQFKVWNCNTLVDDYLAEARIEDNGNESGISKELQLFGRKKEADMEKPGKMKIHICSSNDLQYLWSESGHFWKFFAARRDHIRKCSPSKERPTFTSYIKCTFWNMGTRIY